MSERSEGDSVTLRAIAGFTQCSQIAAYRNGRFSGSLENVKAAMASCSQFADDIPVAVIGITGSTGMGKGFLITCLLDYLENGETGWIKTALDSNEKAREVVEVGFSQSYIATQAIIDHREKSETIGGIYLWPEPFPIKDDKGRQVLTWFMEVGSMKIEEGTDSSELEEFLSVVCSVILELQLNNDSFQIKILEPPPAISSPQDTQYPEPISLEKICDINVQVFRSDTENTQGDALRLLLNANGTVNFKLLRYMRKVLNNVMQSIMEAHLDEKERGMDKDEALELKLGNMHTFMKTSVEKANEHRKQREKAYSVLEESSKSVVSQIQQIFPHFVELWIKDHMSLSTSKQIRSLQGGLIKVTSEHHRGTISSTLWKEFISRINDQCEADCQKTLQNLSDAVSRLCHLINQQFEFHSYVPLEKLKQIASEELQRYENELKVEMNITLLTRLAYEKLIDFYNKQNGTVLENELSLFVNAVSTELGQVYRTEMEQYLKKATYHPLLLESLRVKIIEKVRAEIKNTFETSINAENLGDPPQVFPRDKQTGFTFKSLLGESNRVMLENRMLTLLNMNVRENQEELVSFKRFGNVVQELVNVYHGEMKGLLKDAQLNSQGLQFNHSQLVEKLIDTFENAWKKSNKNIVGQDLRSKRVNLEDTLNTTFSSHYFRTKDGGENGLSVVKGREENVEQLDLDEEALKILLKEAEKAYKETRRLKKENEHERSVMEECFNIAVAQMLEVFPYAINYWISNHLNIPSINKIETIYGDTLHGIIEEHRGAVHSKLWKEFVNRLDGHCKDECIKTLRSIGDPIQKINSAIERQLSLHSYLYPSKLEQISAEAFEKETKNIETGLIRDMIALAYGRLLDIYKHHNDNSSAAKDVVKIGMDHGMEVYREQMNRYLKEAPYSPQKLQKIHSTLVEQLREDFKKACHQSSSVDQPLLEEAISLLKNNLKEAFSFFKEANNNKLKKLQREITKIIQGMKIQYNEKVEDLLNRNPNGLDVNTLSKHHTTIQTEVMKLLEMETRTKIRPNEPLGSHNKALQNHIDSYWFTVVDANKMNLKKAQERVEKEEKQRKKLEAQRQLEEQKREEDRRRRDGIELANERCGVETEREESHIITYITILL